MLREVNEVDDGSWRKIVGDRFFRRSAIAATVERVVPSTAVGAVLRDAVTGAVWQLDEGDSWTIGRSADCDIVLHNDTIGRRHLRIEFASGGWRATDLGSINTVAVNGVRISREELRPGDVLRLGRVLLSFATDGHAPRARGDAGAELATALPQSFDGLMTLFHAPQPSVDSALIAARAGEALLRFCEIPDRRERLRSSFESGLSSAWPVVRAISAHGIAALQAVGAMDEAKAGRSLSPLLSDPDHGVQATAARMLAEIDPLSAAPRLFSRTVDSLMGGHDPREAAEWAGQLTAIADATLIESLRERAEAVAFDVGDPGRRACAASVLGEVAANGEAKAVRALRAMLADVQETVRISATLALARSGLEEARDALRAALGDRSPRVFQESCRALAGARDPLLATRLIEELKATSPDDIERRARYRRALEDVTGERRGPDPASWLR